MRSAPSPVSRTPLAAPPTVNGDPALEVMRSMKMAAEDISRVMAEAKAHAGEHLAARISEELPFAIDRLLLQRYRRLMVLAVLGGLLACAGAGLAGWWLRGAPPGVTCGEQSGGVACWYWIQSPKR